MDDSDDKSFTDDTFQNSHIRADECEVAKKLTDQHGKSEEITLNSKSSKFEVEESLIESTSSVNLHKESLNLHTVPKLHNTEFIRTTKRHNPLGNLSTSFNRDIEIDLLKSKLYRFA